MIEILSVKVFHDINSPGEYLDMKREENCDWSVNENKGPFACRCHQICVILLHRGTEWYRKDESVLLSWPGGSLYAVPS